MAMDADGDVVLEGADLVRDIGRRAGLTDARQKDMVDEYERMMARIRDLEKRHAKVTRDGDTTTIEIARYGNDGHELARRWRDWLDANLTADERAAYKKQNATGQLFKNRLGDFARTVRIKEAGGGVRVTEKAKNKNDEFETRTEAPALARDMVLGEYKHILDE